MASKVSCKVLGVVLNTHLSAHARPDGRGRRAGEQPKSKCQDIGQQRPPDRTSAQKARSGAVLTRLDVRGGLKRPVDIHILRDTARRSAARGAL
jgi:hypothetical protein